MRSLYGGLYETTALDIELKEISFINIVSIYFSNTEFNESDKLCWKREMVLFQ